MKVDKSQDQIWPTSQSTKGNSELHIVEPLKIIFDLSIKTGRLPHDWQSAVVSPMYKKGVKSDPANYRPVSPQL